MNRRWVTVAVVACVLLAGCGSGGGPPATPENPQTTVTTTSGQQSGETSSTSITTEPSRAGLRVKSDADGAVAVTISVSELAGETYYDANRTLVDGESLLLNHVVEDRTPVEVTVAVANDSATRDLVVGEGLVFVVNNESAITAHEVEYAH